VVTFKPETSLAAEGNSYFQAPAGSEQPADDPRISQGMLESSNLNPVGATVNLIALQRHAQLLEQALSVFHSVFNNAPAQELSRVT
jgi:flagellar basal body rod protein FlgG